MIDFEEFEALLAGNRSVRRFEESRRVSRKELEMLVGLTSLCASGRNLQPLRYRPVHSREECAEVFPALAWAGYYKDWDGPVEGERPAAYLVQCLDTELTGNCLCDDGLQLEAITLGARTLGLSACIIKSFNKELLTAALGISDRYRPLYVLALGHAAERVKLVPLPADGDIRYYRDPDSTQCVPKRPLSDLLILSAT